jgi:hypothetical protein
MGGLMGPLNTHPAALSAIALIVLWLSALLGAMARRRRGALSLESREDLSLVLTASLTLLGLIIGFSFSMAISRYDQRKGLEEAEANAIGTEYLRADLLNSEAAALVRKTLRAYLDQRILFYTTGDQDQRTRITAVTAHLQSELWSSVIPFASSQQTPLAALVVSGMNDVLNSQGYTQAAWWNRIPPSAWALMLLVAISCNFMMGYTAARRLGPRDASLVALPLLVSLSAFLIADIDSPRGGIIHVAPENLVALERSLLG